jgi:hypothetical protein
MNDPILAEMHKIKDAMGNRFTSVHSLARRLKENERTTAASGRPLIALPSSSGTLARDRKPKTRTKV